MIKDFCQKQAFTEGLDYKICEKGSITYLYFTDLTKAKSLRTKMSNGAMLKDIDLGLISKIISQKDKHQFFFFVSEERVI